MAGKAEADLFIRSYQTLLRSTGEVRVAGLLEPYLAMDPTLHARARDAHPDAAALTYVGLRLPPSMPNVRLVLLSTSVESIQARGYDLSTWRPEVSPARRRRQLYDGNDQVAILISSQSDLDDVIPALVAGTRYGISFVRSLAAWHLGRLGPRHPGIEIAVPDLRELLNDNDPSVCAEAQVALENLAGKGAPPAELKSLSAHR